MVKSKLRKHKVKQANFLSVTYITLACVVAILALCTMGFSISPLFGHASLLTLDETVNHDQATIPADVLANLEKGPQVLGLNNYEPKDIHVPILIYHYVEYVQDTNDTMRINLNTTPYILEQEIITLKNAGYTFMTNSELNDVLNGLRHLPTKPILLTFDDGYNDFYTDAYPILKKYHVKATQYAVPGFLDTPNYMSTHQLQEIAKDGLVEIADHTVHHMWLKGSDKTTVINEITQGKKMLEKLTHKPVVSFAYPYGAFDQQAIDAVKKAGFTSAMSTILGIDQFQANRYFLFRIRPGGLTGNALLEYLSTVKNSQNL